jgi:hypothetical protein
MPGDDLAARAPTLSSTAAEETSQSGFPTSERANGARQTPIKLRINSTHSRAERGLDMYPTPPEATRSLLALESFPRVVWEPAAGDGAIVDVLRAAGHDVIASDVADYGAGFTVADYLTAPVPPGVEAIVTNPPFSLLLEFAAKAVREVPHVALLARLNALESARRLPFYRAHPPRVLVSSRRLPMMHRAGWDGPRASSNHTFAWLVWRDGVGGTWDVFDWREHVRP